MGRRQQEGWASNRRRVVPIRLGEQREQHDLPGNGPDAEEVGAMLVWEEHDTVARG